MRAFRACIATKRFFYTVASSTFASSSSSGALIEDVITKPGGELPQTLLRHLAPGLPSRVLTTPAWRLYCEATSDAYTTQVIVITAWGG
jgi:hypothetical protein